MASEDRIKKSAFSEKEEEILSFWQENHIFEKTLQETEKGKPFVFYDGPPFATGLPHYGHLLASVLKDAVPRYRTMKGDYVRRVWGWDCHGLPVETLIEKELGLEHKKDIESYGIGKFNEAAKNSVLRYDEEWKKMIPRIGRWIDMEHGYKTMDAAYTESIWWGFKELYKKDFIYKGYKSMHICPRCETTLSSTEVADGYQDVTDISVTAKFELVKEPGTYVLAWTTTPWTLPGNVALAVGEDIEYVEVEMLGGSETEETTDFKKHGTTIVKTQKKETKVIPSGTYIVAKDLVEQVLGVSSDVAKRVLKGKDLIGEPYKPLFNYFAESDIENKENGWKIYAGDFVTTESGTGIVHIAPAFGEDDMRLGKEYNLPFVQHVSFDGRFADEVKDFAGLYVKPKDDHQATDIEIIKYLAHKGLLFDKKKITHSYPHCWRCDTPLLNYATSSWFIAVPKMRNELLKRNQDINWIPATIKDGRFKNLLEGAPDWSISRARFWGAPLPVWECDTCNTREVLGSVDEIKEKTKNTNNIIVMRHGEAQSNVTHTISDDPKDENPLTEQGRKEVARAAESLKDKKIDLIIASDFLRTKETAGIVAESLGISKDAIVYDERLREIKIGEWGKGTWSEYRSRFSSEEDRLVTTPPGGESGLDVKRRIGEFLFEINAKYTGKNILIVSHGFPIAMCFAVSDGLSNSEITERANLGEDFETADTRELSFAPIPHNKNYELDMHRPYIDEVAYICGCGGKMKRIPEVFDCWVESGSMPFAQFHYPFENKELFEKNFPADFIAEGIDQTRGWFYTLLVISNGLFGKAPYKNVVVNGLILAEDGRKMSKKLKNYPQPEDVIHKYSADALRYYLLSSPVVHGEELRFSEKGVDEIQKKVLIRLANVVSFYELHKEENISPDNKSKNILDAWIFARLDQTIGEIEYSLDKYELDRAVRPIGVFVDDLSTWYLRRSRDRFKGDEKREALSALGYVLQQLAKAIAPFMPFAAEDVYKRTGGEKESVHLEMWPSVSDIPAELIDEMKKTRDVVSLALEERARAGIKVRQPLAALYVSDQIGKEYIELVKDEVNVKEVLEDKGVQGVRLDTSITPELKKEGDFREFVRNVQDLRKTMRLTPNDAPVLMVYTSEAGQGFIREFERELKKATLLRGIEFTEVSEGKEVLFDDFSFAITLII